jgi:hypothetical protein
MATGIEPVFSAPVTDIGLEILLGYATISQYFNLRFQIFLLRDAKILGLFSFNDIIDLHNDIISSLLFM